MTRMSLTADNIRDGVIAMAKIWLRLNKEYSVGYRTVLVAGDDDMGGIVTWCSDDINSYDVEFTAENELRHSADKHMLQFRRKDPGQVRKCVSSQKLRSRFRIGFRQSRSGTPGCRQCRACNRTIQIPITAYRDLAICFPKRVQLHLTLKL